jgi:hypothetical protein
VRVYFADKEGELEGEMDADSHYVLMQGVQYDRPSEDAVMLARKRMGGTVGRVKDRLEVRYQHPATMMMMVVVVVVCV